MTRWSTRTAIVGTLLLGMLIAAVVRPDASFAAPSAPAGYTVSQVVGNASLGPVTGLTELADGSVLMGHQQGTIRRYNPTGGATTVWATVPIAVGPDGAIGVSGLLDILHLPASASAPEQVVVSFTCFNGGIAVHCIRVFGANGTVVLTNKYGPPLIHWQNPGSHNGGGLAHDDRYLYVGTGDDTESADVAQDLTSMKGKILRFDRSALDGTPTIVAYGIRQPYGMFMHEGELIEFDVGQKTFESINRIVPDPDNPPNFGWKAAGDGDASAWLTYPHQGPDEPYGYAIIGGDVWADGRLYFADHPRGIIFSVDLDDPTDVVTFSSGWQYVTNLFSHSDGSLLVATRSGGLWEVADSDGSPPPPPTSTTTTQPDGGTGHTIGFEATPRADFTFDEDVTWSVDLAHDDSADGSGFHTHPQIPDTQSDHGSFSLERPVGHEDANIWWQVTATAADGTIQMWRVDGTAVEWTPIEGTQPPPPPVLTEQVTFVAGSSNPTSRDRAFIDHLVADGYLVTIVDDSAVTAGTGAGTVVVISTSVTITDKLEAAVEGITAPIVTFEGYLAHEIGMATGPNHGAGEASLGGVSMADLAVHPIVAGLSDPAPIFDGPGQRWNRIKLDFLSPQATALGTTSGVVVSAVNETRKSVLLPWTYPSMDNLTADGWTLFDNAVEWAGS